MSSEIKNDSNLCFVCLQESTDPKVCSHCGAEISTSIGEEFQFEPPKKVRLKFNFKQINLFSKGDLIKAIEDIKVTYKNNFEIKDSYNSIEVECNDLAEERLINQLKIKELVDKRVILREEI